MKSIHPVSTRRRLVGAAVIAVAFLAGPTALAGSQAEPSANADSPRSSASGAPVFPGDAAVQGRSAGSTPTNAAAGAGTELQFVSVTPCRAIDTRHAGGALNNSSRNFVIAGLSNYSSQGGNSAGCGIPSYAVGIQMNLGTVTVGSGSGYLKGWPFGAAEPTASLVNFSGSGAIANMVTLPLSNTAASDITLKVFGNAHVFADVAGYYVNPMYATITDTGAVYRTSSGLVSSSRTSVGEYVLTFERPTARCAAVASDLIFATTNDVSAEAGFGGSNVVTVEVRDNSGSLADTFFNIHLTC